MAEIRDVVRKKNGGRGASSYEFVRKIGFPDFFFVGDATQGNADTSVLNLLMLRLLT